MPALGAREKVCVELFVSVGLCRLDREIEIVALLICTTIVRAVCVGVGVSVAVVLAVVVAGIHLT